MAKESAPILQSQEDTNNLQKVENYDYTGMLNKNKEPLTPDYQRWISDVNPLKNAFYFRLCGWRIVTKTRKVKKAILGEKYESYEALEIDKVGRVMDENGGEHYYYDLYPMINQVLTSSKLKRSQIYKTWNAKILTLILELNRMAFSLDGENHYHINPNRTTNAITFFCSLWNISFKAEDGFTTTHLADQITSATLIKHDIDPRDQIQSGFFDKLNPFKASK